MNFPRVLILGQPFNENTGGGITLSNFFNGWDKKKIAVACSGYLLSNYVNSDICNTYYQLGHEERRLIFPLNLVARKYYSGLIQIPEKGNNDLTVVKSKARVKVIMDYLYPSLNFLGLFPAMSKTGLSKKLCAWLDEYQPEVIYAQATSRESILFCLEVHKYLKKPMIFHMMDDWPSTFAGKGLFKNYWQKKINREFKKLLDEADVLMSISDEMAEEYKRKYDKTFVTFLNSINIDFWKSSQKENYKLNEIITILYAGRIGLGIDTSLEIIANAVQKINSDLSRKARFILQTNEKPLWAENYSCIEYRSFVPYKELPKKFSEVDFLILPYDFSPEAIRYIKLSMPTKAPEYMASGTPIIIFAPEETALVEYAKKNNWAKIVTNKDVNELFSAMKDLIENEKERSAIAQNAQVVAVKNHDSISVRQNFQRIISSLVYHTQN